MSFRSERYRAGITARAASIALDVSQVTIFAWENGSHLPEAKRLPEIAKLYGCTVDDLLRAEQDSA